MRRPVESAQYTSHDYTQELDDAEVLASIGSVGDALDNALAESFVDSYKTELIADRVWRTRAQLELATVEYVGWFNHQRLHESLGDIPPVEFEQRDRASERLTGPIPGGRSVADRSPRVADRLTTRPPAADDVRDGQNSAKRLSLPATAAAPAANSTAQTSSERRRHRSRLWK